MDDGQQEHLLEQKAEVRQTASRRELLIRLLAIALVIVITLVVWRVADRLERFKLWGYPGIFVVSLLGNATVILPAPSLALVFAMGGILNPQRNGALTVFVLSAIPNPFFDLAGIAAGVLRYPIARFLLFCWLGKTIKTVAFAFAGAYSITFFERFL